MDRGLQRRRQLRPAHDACNEPNELSTVTQAVAAIATQATPTVTVGSADHRHGHGHRLPGTGPHANRHRHLHPLRQRHVHGCADLHQRQPSVGRRPAADGDLGAVRDDGGRQLQLGGGLQRRRQLPGGHQPLRCPQRDHRRHRRCPPSAVDKTATPPSRTAPGGDFTFNVVVTNTSPEVLTITSLTDDVYGDITTRANSTCTTAIGTVLQPSARARQHLQLCPSPPPSPGWRATARPTWSPSGPPTRTTWRSPTATTPSSP